MVRLGPASNRFHSPAQSPGSTPAHGPGLAGGEKKGIVMPGTLKEFPKSMSPDPPDPDPPAALAFPDPGEKRLEVISLRAPDGTRAYIQCRAQELGISPSSYCLSLIEKDWQQQVLLRQQSRRDGLSEAVSELSRETAIALKDGRIDPQERVRMTRPAAWILAFLWRRRVA